MLGIEHGGLRAPQAGGATVRYRIVKERTCTLGKVPIGGYGPTGGGGGGGWLPQTHRARAKNRLYYSYHIDTTLSEARREFAIKSLRYLRLDALSNEKDPFL
jgi:hypothetical protein